MCHSSDEPIFVTKNGYGDMVLMSIETYEKSMRNPELCYALELSEIQVNEGKVKNAKKALTALRKKYGL